MVIVCQDHADPKFKQNHMTCIDFVQLQLDVDGIDSSNGNKIL